MACESRALGPAPATLAQLVPSNVHVSLRSLPLLAPPKSTIFPPMHDPALHALEHTVHAAPAVPHALVLVPTTHSCPDAQHPLHDVVSHAQTPCAQRSPVAHDPFVHTVLQPSLSPQALPRQSGVQFPTPQTFGPPPPHVPDAQPPHSTIVPQTLLICPHLPGHTTVSAHASPGIAAWSPPPSFDPGGGRLASADADARSKSAPRREAQPATMTPAIAGRLSARKDGA
jgi:hypothetical protein